MIEVADGNDAGLAAGIAVASMMQLFFFTQNVSCVGINRAHVIVLNSSPQENAQLTI